MAFNGAQASTAPQTDTDSPLVRAVHVTQLWRHQSSCCIFLTVNFCVHPWLHVDALATFHYGRVLPCTLSLSNCVCSSINQYADDFTDIDCHTPVYMCCFYQLCYDCIPCACYMNALVYVWTRSMTLHCVLSAISAWNLQGTPCPESASVRHKTCSLLFRFLGAMTRRCREAGTRVSMAMWMMRTWKRQTRGSKRPTSSEWTSREQKGHNLSARQG